MYEPSRNATRVRPPGITQVCSPESTKGRRSARRGFRWSPSSVGIVVNSRRGWAIQLRGSASTWASVASRSALEASFHHETLGNLQP